jgi:hypothetical protein
VDKEFEEIWKEYNEQKEQIGHFTTRFGQLDKIVFPSIWEKLRDIDKRTAISPNLGGDFMEAIRSIEGALQSRLVRDIGDISSIKEAMDRDIQQVRGQMARQDEEVLRVLDLATAHAAYVLFGNIIKFSPVVEPSCEVISDESERSIVEYLSAIQKTLAGSDYIKSMENILKNAQAQIVRKFEAMPAHDYPNGVTPAIATRRAIVRCQLEWLLDWMKEQQEALQGQIAAQRATLANLLNLRRRY